MKKSFKTRAKDAAIQNAQVYKNVFLDYEYLICSTAFTDRDFYMIRSYKENYMHLTGINSALKPKEFYDACINGSLKDEDILLTKDKNANKNKIKSKMKAISNLNKFFSDNLMVEEHFEHNRVICTFSGSDSFCTIGFIPSENSRPMTILYGNKLDPQKSKKADLVLRKSRDSDYFDEIVVGELSSLQTYYERISQYVDSSLIKSDLHSSPMIERFY